MRQFRGSDFLNGHIVVLFGIQAVGWLVLTATFDHSPSPFVGGVQALPEIGRVLLLPFAVLALPAVVLSTAVGAMLSAFGRPPQSIPAVLVTQGDILVFASAYLLAVVGAGWIRNRTTTAE